jgi:tetratricopeptide (TPR) repeat protein
MNLRSRHRFRASLLVASWARRWYAAWLEFAGRTEEAEAVLRRAAADRPESFSAALAHGRSLLALGRDAEAREALRRACRLDRSRFLRRRDLPAVWREVIAVECAAALPEGPDPRGGPFEIEPATEALRGFSPAAVEDPPPPGSDFVSGAEARRFQGLAALDKTTAKDVDWDVLLDRLARSAQPGGPRGA